MRPGRTAEIAPWVYDWAKRRDAECEPVDIKDCNVPFLDDTQWR
jgi:hypothetical protein